MTKPRELDVLMAQKVLGHKVYHEKTGAMRERLPSGQSRPLRNFTTDISAAWEVVEAFGMTLLPVDQGWFALVGQKKGWQSPAEFITYLQTADFANSGAAVGEQAPLTICLAAMKALERRTEKSPKWPDEGDDETKSDSPMAINDALTERLGLLDQNPG